MSTDKNTSFTVLIDGEIIEQSLGSESFGDFLKLLNRTDIRSFALAEERKDFARAFTPDDEYLKRYGSKVSKIVQLLEKINIYQPRKGVIDFIVTEKIAKYSNNAKYSNKFRDVTDSGGLSYFITKFSHLDESCLAKLKEQLTANLAKEQSEQLVTTVAGNGNSNSRPRGRTRLPEENEPNRRQDIESLILSLYQLIAVYRTQQAVQIAQEEAIEENGDTLQSDSNYTPPIQNAEKQPEKLSVEEVPVEENTLLTYLDRLIGFLKQVLYELAEATKAIPELDEAMGNDGASEFKVFKKVGQKRQDITNAEALLLYLYSLWSEFQAIGRPELGEIQVENSNPVNVSSSSIEEALIVHTVDTQQLVGLLFDSKIRPVGAFGETAPNQFPNSLSHENTKVQDSLKAPQIRNDEKQDEIFLGEKREGSSPDPAKQPQLSFTPQINLENLSHKNDDNAEGVIKEVGEPGSKSDGIVANLTQREISKSTFKKKSIARRGFTKTITYVSETGKGVQADANSSANAEGENSQAYALSESHAIGKDARAHSVSRAGTTGKSSQAIASALAKATGENSQADALSESQANGIGSRAFSISRADSTGKGSRAKAVAHSQATGKNAAADAIAEARSTGAGSRAEASSLARLTGEGSQADVAVFAAAEGDNAFAKTIAAVQETNQGLQVNATVIARAEGRNAFAKTIAAGQTIREKPQTGGQQRDALINGGSDGKDPIAGRYSNDFLIGNFGSDRLTVDKKKNKIDFAKLTNQENIIDTDLLGVSAKNFGSGLTTGKTFSAFQSNVGIGSASVGSEHRSSEDRITGNLLFDSDEFNMGKISRFARSSDGLNMNSQDLFMI